MTSTTLVSGKLFNGVAGLMTDGVIKPDGTKMSLEELQENDTETSQKGKAEAQANQTSNMKQLAQGNGNELLRHIVTDQEIRDWTGGKPGMLQGDMLSMVREAAIMGLELLLSHDFRREIDPNLKGANAVNRFAKTTCDDPQIDVQYVQADSGMSLREATRSPASFVYTWARDHDFNMIIKYIEDTVPLFGYVTNFIIFFFEYTLDTILV